MIAESTHVVPTVDMRSEGKHVMKNLFRIMVMFAIVLIGFLGAALAYLSYPGTPNRSKFMTFDGYIGLPEDRLLNVLDYLTLNGNTLFVTSESSGALFKFRTQCVCAWRWRGGCRPIFPAPPRSFPHSPSGMNTGSQP